MTESTKISKKVIERLSEYRTALDEQSAGEQRNIFSHELARLCGVTAAQVRRDLMSIGFSGSSAKGYDINELKQTVSDFLGFGEERRVVLVGIGHLGRALLDFFVNRHPKLVVCAGFDVNEMRINRVIHGVRCYAVSEMERVVAENRAQVGIITVPESAAQETAERLVEAGVTGVLNFAPVQLRVPGHVFVENLNISTVLEKVAYFAGLNADRERVTK
ncbi:MAG: redox-sensing transcriptional repressor Rex [Deltaproteobacteria bacterium]|nr:redox-sensing transcriptional repressor Rex [Deltaproteobacteria bacterium]MBN2670508.1 redox-sensing transcriptional repressor Rex [Deltaproteobacteria bacterium]